MIVLLPPISSKITLYTLSTLSILSIFIFTTNMIKDPSVLQFNLFSPMKKLLKDGVISSFILLHILQE